mgnify:CR=1 FL=1
MTTTEINNTLVELESLHKAYAEILEAAKEQLESLEVSDSTITQISDKLSTTTELRQAVARSTFDLMRQFFTENADDADTDCFARGRFIDLLSVKVLEAVKKEVQAQISEAVMDVLNTGVIERRLEQKVINNDAINSALLVHKGLASLLNDLPSNVTQ